MSLPTVLDAAELAVVLKVTKAWIWEECRAGRMPHTRVGRRVRFTEEHVHQILAAGEQSSPTVKLASVASLADARKKIA